MSTDLHTLLDDALPSQRQLDTLHALGVPGEAMTRAGGFGVAKVTFFDDGSFEFNGSAKAMIIPANRRKPHERLIPILIPIIHLISVHIH